MIEVSGSGAPRRTIFCGNVGQDTDRNARTASKVYICRTLVWMIAVIVPPADERLPTAVLCTDRVPVLQ
jgi:hypothetical protein